MRTFFSFKIIFQAEKAIKGLANMIGIIKKFFTSIAAPP